MGQGEIRGLSSEVVDSDHTYLRCLVDTIELALRTGQPLHVLRTAVAQLRAHAHRHFDTEERLMIAVGFDRFDAHRRQHRQLLWDFDNQVRPVADAAADPPQAGILDGLVNYLREWLGEHIETEDAQFEPLLAKLPAGYYP